MIRKMFLVAATAAMLSSTPVLAAQCRDSKGKFTKCPEKTAPAKPVKCKDAKGKFAKCGTPGAKPM